MLHIRVMIFDQIKAEIVHTLTILRVLRIYIYIYIYNKVH